MPLDPPMVGLSGILQGHCVVKLGMDEDLLEQVTQPSDWVLGRERLLELPPPEVSISTS